MKLWQNYPVQTLLSPGSPQPPPKGGNLQVLMEFLLLLSVLAMPLLSTAFLPGIAPEQSATAVAGDYKEMWVRAYQATVWDLVWILPATVDQQMKLYAVAVVTATMAVCEAAVSHMSFLPFRDKVV